MCPGDCTLALKVHLDIWNEIRDHLQWVVEFGPLANQLRVSRLPVNLLQCHACCQFTRALDLCSGLPWVSDIRPDS